MTPKVIGITILVDLRQSDEKQPDSDAQSSNSVPIFGIDK